MGLTAHGGSCVERDCLEGLASAHVRRLLLALQMLGCCVQQAWASKVQSAHLSDAFAVSEEAFDRFGTKPVKRARDLHLTVPNK